METYCVSCKKNTTNKNSTVRRTKKKNQINACLHLPCLSQEKIDIQYKLRS